MPKGEDKQEDWLTLQLNGTQNVTTGFFFDWFTGSSSILFLNFK